jgi:hypothetical protein
MEKIVRGSDLSADELQTLREIVLRGFLSRGAISQNQRGRLSLLGLVHCAMGGVMPTPAGRITARM